MGLVEIIIRLNRPLILHLYLPSIYDPVYSFAVDP